ncbi:MAG: aminomethyl-transferring glycine dehydrogenase subunit GcvPA [Desulfurococcales archaeon]|nr:aminomethyl-transferring glycine dehydrogenase subunit GcvPA [Desulfurococcales archaeon]
MKSHPWMPNSSPQTVSEMLREIGLNDLMELFRDIPDEIILPEAKLNSIGNIMDESKINFMVNEKISRDKIYLPNRIFRPPCPHIIPAIVRHIMGRSEFYTSYTPYQPEVSQGLLQAFFEYQSMIADLFELDVVNASHYDGATALAEAVLMSFRVKRKYTVILDSYIDPFYKQVIETYLSGINGRTMYLDNLESEKLKGILETQDTASVVIDNPTFFGRIRENTVELAEIAHDHGALVVSLVEPLSLGIIKPPGEYNADIAVGEGRNLGLGLNYGGYGLGIIAVKWDSKLVRQMPGRIIGLGEDVDGNRAYLMILQTREQHIRREKATSNITTNQALTTIGAAVFMALLGKTGFTRIGEIILKKTKYLADLFSEINPSMIPSRGYYFERLPASFHDDYAIIEKAIRSKGILPGIPLGHYWNMLTRRALFCASEVHRKEDLKTLVDTIKEAIQG